MKITQSDTVALQTESDVVAARQCVRKLTQQARFSLVDQTKMVTAASELGRNAVKYGGGGAMNWEIIEDGGRSGVRLHFVDHGPGIADLDQAMTDGWTSGGGLGMGLSGAKRLVNDFLIESKRGEGTHVTITRWR